MDTIEDQASHLATKELNCFIFIPPSSHSPTIINPYLFNSVSGLEIRIISGTYGSHRCWLQEIKTIFLRKPLASLF